MKREKKRKREKERKREERERNEKIRILNLKEGDHKDRNKTIIIILTFFWQICSMYKAINTLFSLYNNFATK